ncbi:MAG: hypothetical protein FJ296_01710 [Planctomycetes bacterium]|nr:hypothetical protein [Planctomycetota bacterium]
MKASNAALLLLALASPGVAAQSTGQPAAAPAADAGAQRFDELGLTLRFGPDLPLSRQPKPRDARVPAAWAGTLGAAKLTAQLVLVGDAGMGLSEPSQVLELVRSDLSDRRSGGNPSFRFDELAHWPGPFGVAAYASYGRSAERDEQGPLQVFRVAGLLPDSGWLLDLRARPELPAADAAKVRDALAKAVTWDGEPRDARWSKAEAEERWQQSVPEDLADELEDVLRTPHYVILTNSSGGKSFAKKMEECHAAIRKVFPFEEVEGRRLLPVFLFRTADQYFEFFARAFNATVEDGRRTGGVASGDFYATWYEAPGDPVHIHEATHQIFANRLGLGGAGSWFQEGVAEYMSTKDNERGMAAKAVEKGRHVPLAEFFKVQSLIFSSDKEDLKGEDASGNQYKQAALLIEFLREGKWGKAKFLDFVHAVGAVPRNDLGAIEGALRRVYDTDVAGLEKEFVAYCKKR